MRSYDFFVHANFLFFKYSHPVQIFPTVRRDEGGPAPIIIPNAQSHFMVDFLQWKLYHFLIKRETSPKATNIDPGFMSTLFSR